MKKILFIILIASVFGCNNDNGSNGSNITKYFFGYMMYPEGMAQNLSTDNLVDLEYDSNNRIVKRIGGYREMDFGTGYTHSYDESIFDQLTYSSNEILIEKKTNSTLFEVAKFERKLILDNQNRIVKKINYHELGFPAKDTTYYTYDSNGRLIETKKSIFHEVETAIFYYNQANNLDSIVTKKNHYDNPMYKIVEHFSNYDTASNPLKKLLIFEETFYRALSKNNFKRYDKREYNALNELIGTSFKTWNLIYDSNGKVKFDQF